MDESPTAAASAAARAVAAAALASMGSLSHRQQQEVVAAAAAGSEGIGDSRLLGRLSLRCLQAMLLHALSPVSKGQMTPGTSGCNLGSACRNAAGYASGLGVHSRRSSCMQQKSCSRHSCQS